jgi:4-amino-4-deoxy-L-arabinose transferase-like glycosyltransferase
MRLELPWHGRFGKSIWPAAALAAGLALRLWFVWRHAYVSGDTLLYGDIAQNLLRHGVYGFSETTAKGIPYIRPTLIRLPGYPLFLLVCFAVFGVGKYTAVLLVQVAMDLWSCLLLASVARRLFGPPAGLAALWLGALCPFLANYAACPLTETPTLWCMALAFYALVRWRERGGMNRWLWVLGFALAWAILLRPEQGLLAAALVPALAWMAWKSGAGWRPVALVCVLTLLPLAPWTARNWRTFHVLQPLAPKYANDPGESNPYGFQRWYRTWAIDFASTDQVYWNYDGDTISIGDLPNRAFDSNQQYAATEAALNQYNQTTTATPAVDAKFAAIAAQRIAADPLRYYVALPVARLLNMILRPRVDNLPVPLEWWKFRAHPGATLFAGFYAALNLMYLLLAGDMVGRRRLWTDWAPVVWAMVGTIALRCTLLLTIDNSEPRYTLEFYPVLIVLASGTFARRVRARKRGTA